MMVREVDELLCVAAALLLAAHDWIDTKRREKRSLPRPDLTEIKYMSLVGNGFCVVKQCDDMTNRPNESSY